MPNPMYVPVPSLYLGCFACTASTCWGAWRGARSGCKHAGSTASLGSSRQLRQGGRTSLRSSPGSPRLDCRATAPLQQAPPPRPSNSTMVPSFGRFAHKSFNWPSLTLLWRRRCPLFKCLENGHWHTVRAALQLPLGSRERAMHITTAGVLAAATQLPPHKPIARLCPLSSSLLRLAHLKDTLEPLSGLRSALSPRKCDAD
jgi:hypothetical protein